MKEKISAKHTMHVMFLKSWEADKVCYMEIFTIIITHALIRENLKWNKDVSSSWQYFKISEGTVKQKSVQCSIRSLTKEELCIKRVP